MGDQMADRIREIRAVLHLTQTEFGSKVGLTRSAMQKIEYGYNLPSKAAVQLICKVFSVSESWLVNGEGEMFRTDAPGSATMAILGSKYESSPLVRAILDAYIALPIEDQQKAERFVARLALSIADGVSPEDLATDVLPEQSDTEA